MPIFEYACHKCGKVFEKLVLGKKPEVTKCPHCGSPRTEQQFSSFATSGASAKPGGGGCSSGRFT
ncbi:MAG TPA: zinc ribbon domain-containing protein [Terriglobia bacterium]|nr:zinc ribbon domain-containing protein [Terriglobia bacterium]